MRRVCWYPVMEGIYIFSQVLFHCLFAGRAWDQDSAWSFESLVLLYISIDSRVTQIQRVSLYYLWYVNVVSGYAWVSLEYTGAGVFTSCWGYEVNMLSKKELEELRPWVSERVTAFLGFSEDTVVNAALDCVAKSLSRQATTGKWVLFYLERTTSAWAIHSHKLGRCFSIVGRAEKSIILWWFMS